MALFLSVFTRPVAEVNITEANRDKLEISWYSLLGCIQGDMMVFIFFFSVLNLTHRDKKITGSCVKRPKS